MKMEEWRNGEMEKWRNGEPVFFNSLRDVVYTRRRPIPWPRPGLQNAVQGIHFRNTTGTAVCSRHFAPGQAPVLQYSIAPGESKSASS